MALTKKQQKIRATGIGASEIPVVAGLSKYGSVAEIWARKLGVDNRDPTLAMELGTLTEDPIARLYAKRTARHLEKVTTLRHPEHAIIVATPDRLVFPSKPSKGFQPRDAERLLQVKHTTWRLRSLWGAEGTDEVPEDHLAQVTWEMGTAGVPLCDVAVLFDKDEFRIYSVAFMRALFDQLRAIGDHFWASYVLPKVAPPAEASERYREALSSIYPSEKSTELLAPTPQLEDLIFRLRVLEAVTTEADKRAEKIRNELRRFIGEATGIVSRAGTITWKKARDSEKTDWQAVAVELRDELAAILAMRPEATKEAAETEASQIFGVVVKKNTETKPGSRRLYKGWAKTLPPALEELIDIPTEEIDAGAIVLHGERMPALELSLPVRALFPDAEARELAALEEKAKAAKDDPELVAQLEASIADPVPS